MSQKFYSIRARANASSAEVLIYGDIGESWWGEFVTAKEFVREIAALDVDELTVRINSYGGSVSDGIAIFNALKRHKAHVTISIDGVAASIASLIAMAGDTIEMAENSLLMIHAPWGYAVGNSADMREYADMLDTWSQAMATSYAAQTDKPLEEMLSLLTDGEDHWYTAEEAKAAGFVDDVVTAIPMAASIDRAAVAAHIKSMPVPGVSPAAAAAQPEKEKDMPQATPAAGETQAVNEADIRASALAADTQRRTAIKALKTGAVAKFEGIDTVIEAAADDVNCTVDIARERVLAHMAKDATPVAGDYVVTVEDGTDKLRAAAVSAMLARAAVPGAKPVDGSNPFRGMKLLDIARDSLARAGINTRGMDQRAIVAAAFTQSTSDFPILLENTMHKALQQAYAVQPDTWSRICAPGTVSDFRAHPRYRVGSIGTLDSKNELGEFKNKSIPDGEKGSITAGTKGNIINLSREAIINDDLGAFVGLATTLGRAAKRTIEVDFYALLALNGGLGPVMEDGKTLFHADHGNLTAGAALSMLAIDADRVAMKSQRDVGGNDYLDLVPAVLLLAVGLGGTARSINDAQYDPDTANKLQKPNIVNGLFRDIVDTPRLSGTRRYLFADYNEAPVIECAFLDGNQTPYLELQNGFEVDGASWKVRLDYGFAAIDYRGAVTNAGQ
jgi:ATP-dependent protease ClpP protease subunit